MSKNIIGRLSASLAVLSSVIAFSGDVQAETCGGGVREPELVWSDGERIGCHDDGFYDSALDGYYSPFESKTRWWKNGWGWPVDEEDTDTQFCAFAERAWFVMALSDNSLSGSEVEDYLDIHTGGIKPACGDPNNREDEPIKLPTVERGWAWLRDAIGNYSNDNRKLRLEAPFFDASLIRGVSLFMHGAEHGTDRVKGLFHKRIERGGRHWYVDERYGSGSSYTKQLDWLLAYIDNYTLSEEERTHDGKVRVRGSTAPENSPGPLDEAGPEPVVLVKEVWVKDAIAIANEIVLHRFVERPPIRVEPYDVEALARNAGPMGTVDPTQQLVAEDCQVCPNSNRRAVFDAGATDPCGFTFVDGNLSESDHSVRFEPYEFEYVDTGNPASRNSLFVTNEDANPELLKAGGICFEDRTVIFERTYSRGSGENDDVNTALVDSDGNPISTDDATCFLTGIRGNFEGVYERIGVYVDDGEWKVRLYNNNDLSSNRPMEGKVTCVDAPLVETVRQENNGAQWSSPFANSDVACALSDLNGRFRNFGDNSATITQVPCTPEVAILAGIDPAYCNHWQLAVDENWTLDRRISASMTCFGYSE